MTCIHSTWWLADLHLSWRLCDQSAEGTGSLSSHTYSITTNTGRETPFSIGSLFCICCIQMSTKAAHLCLFTFGHIVYQTLTRNQQPVHENSSTWPSSIFSDKNKTIIKTEPSISEANNQKQNLISQHNKTSARQKAHLICLPSVSKPQEQVDEPTRRQEKRKKHFVRIRAESSNCQPNIVKSFNLLPS